MELIYGSGDSDIQRGEGKTRDELFIEEQAKAVVESEANVFVIQTDNGGGLAQQLSAGRTQEAEHEQVIRDVHHGLYCHQYSRLRR